MRIDFRRPLVDLWDRTFTENGQPVTLGAVVIRCLLTRGNAAYEQVEKGFDTARRIKAELEKNGDAEPLDVSVEEAADMIRLVKSSDLVAQVKVPAVRILEGRDP